MGLPWQIQKACPDLVKCPCQNLGLGVGRDSWSACASFSGSGVPDQHIFLPTGNITLEGAFLYKVGVNALQRTCLKQA